MISSGELLTELDQKRIDALIPLIERDIRLLEQDGPIAQFDFSLNGGHHLLDGHYLNKAQFAELCQRYGGTWLIQQKYEAGAGRYLRFVRRQSVSAKEVR